MQHFSEDERLARARAFLRTVTVVRTEAPQAEPRPGELDAVSLSVLVTCALQPGVFLTDLYASLGLHPAEGRKAVSDVQARGYVRAHRLVRSGRGGQPTVLEVRKSGVAVLAQRGVSPAGLLLPRGGFVHSVYAAWVKARCEAAGSRVRCECTLGQKCFDLVEERRDGTLVGYEVCCSGDAAYNAEALVRGASVAGLAQVVGVCANKALLQRVGRALQGRLEALRIALRFAGEFCPLRERE